MFLSPLPEYPPKIAELGLKQKYQEDYDFNEFCRMLDGLAFCQ